MVELVEGGMGVPSPEELAREQVERCRLEQRHPGECDTVYNLLLVIHILHNCYYYNTLIMVDSRERKVFHFREKVFEKIFIFFVLPNH